MLSSSIYTLCIFLKEADRQERTRPVWERLFPGEPFHLNYQSAGGWVAPTTATTTTATTTAMPPFSYDILAASKRQEAFAYQVAVA